MKAMFEARAIFALALASGCGDDGGGGDGSDASTTSVEETGGSEAASASSTSTGASSTTTTGESSSSSGDASSSSSDDGGSSSSGNVDDGTYAAIVRGTLFTDDLAEAQVVHDMVAMGGEKSAMALGDFGHDAKLGTTLLGTTENAFLALDQWDNLAGAQTTYSDPKFVEAFATMFAEPPSLELFRLRDDWHGWGDPEAGDASEPHFFVIVRGRLAEADIEAAQAMHDPLAMGGEETATALGDVAHVVWLGAEDEREFLALDVWTDDANIEAFYTNPDLMAAFGALFDGPATIGVYRSTDWYQW